MAAGPGRSTGPSGRQPLQRGLPVAKALCYIPAGDRPVQLCAGSGCLSALRGPLSGATIGKHTKGFAISRDLRINQMIRVPDVRVVDEDGGQLGVMRTMDALRLAQERGLDLVEVAPLAVPPVVRLLDFGQYKYELTKREKEAKRRQRSITFKEVRLKPKIGVGDFDTKVRRAVEFLEDGDRVKVSVQFRGRELTHPQIGRDLLDKFAKQVEEHGIVERPPLLEGKSMHISLASTHKPKTHEPPANAPAKGHVRAEGQAPAADAGEAETNQVQPAPPAEPKPEPEAGAASTGR
jgi:translation initiation factor IF-3